MLGTKPSLLMRSIRKVGRASVRFLLPLFVFFFVIGTIPIISTAEISHENFELIGSELDMLIGLLRTTINATEMSLVALYYEQLAYANENLSIVNGLLSPAEQLLGDIEDIAGSYTNLSLLMPPFTSLFSREKYYLLLEADFLTQRDFLISLSGKTNLTDEETIAALIAINRADSLIVVMNRTIDRMIESATEITELEVEESRPFSDNNLVELLERLRDHLRTLELLLAEIVEGSYPGGGIQWDKSYPFLTLWIASTQLYLGDVIVGGGYLFYNGSFVSNHKIQIIMDDDNLTTAITMQGGDYQFQKQIPINQSWLGSHSIFATTQIEVENLSSNVTVISIWLIPTIISVQVDDDIFSLDEQATVRVQLRDFLGNFLENMNCILTVDNNDIPFSTDELGEQLIILNTNDLGFGSHSINASFDGVLPYASSSSITIEIEVSIPTTIELNLFIERPTLGYYLTGNGTLYANYSDQLADQIVTLFIDGEEILNLTTQPNGEFSFAIETIDMRVGPHIIRAAFVYKESIWRYSEDEKPFTVFVPKPTKQYPFWPYIPGWGGISPPQDFANLFFGEYAYYTWLLIVLAIGIIVKTMQIRKSRREKIAEKPETFEPIIQELEISEDGRPVEYIREPTGFLEPPSNPNDRIIWYYNQFLSFLRGERKISIKDSMTHWEIARLLKALEYPFSIIERITILFERAFYSGAALSDTESGAMGEAVDQMKTVGEEKPHESQD